MAKVQNELSLAGQKMERKIRKGFLAVLEGRPPSNGCSVADKILGNGGQRK